MFSQEQIEAFALIPSFNRYLRLSRPDKRSTRDGLILVIHLQRIVRRRPAELIPFVCLGDVAEGAGIG